MLALPRGDGAPTRFEAQPVCSRIGKPATEGRPGSGCGPINFLSQIARKRDGAFGSSRHKPDGSTGGRTERLRRLRARR